MRPTISVIIATLNRPQPLRDTLVTLRAQSLSATEVVVVDSSSVDDTRLVVEQLVAEGGLPLMYIASAVRSAAVQRNLGVEGSSGEILVFMDDDVLLDRDFLKELVQPLVDDAEGKVAGVNGTIVNQTYSQPKGINRLLLGCCLGNFDASWAGRLLGPAVNFLPMDRPDAVQRVDWLFSGGTAYRRDLFKRYYFGSQFTGYSFGEDVHLSARIARDYTLLNTTKARFEHLDLGGGTHRDWAALGESMVTNRALIMREVMGRDRTRHLVQLFAYEVLYLGLATLAQSRLRPKPLLRAGLMVKGKLRAFWKLGLPARRTVPARQGN